MLKEIKYSWDEIYTEGGCLTNYSKRILLELAAIEVDFQFSFYYV